MERAVESRLGGRRSPLHGGFRVLSRRRRSGDSRRRLRDAEYLIDRECHHAEHEVAFDLDRAAPRTDRAPNSSFSRALTRSARVRKLKMTSIRAQIHSDPNLRQTSLLKRYLVSTSHRCAPRWRDICPTRNACRPPADRQAPRHTAGCKACTTRFRRPCSGANSLLSRSPARWLLKRAVSSCRAGKCDAGRSRQISVPSWRTEKHSATKDAGTCGWVWRWRPIASTLTLGPLVLGLHLSGQAPDGQGFKLAFARGRLWTAGEPRDDLADRLGERHVSRDDVGAARKTVEGRNARTRQGAHERKGLAENWLGGYWASNFGSNVGLAGMATREFP